MENAWPFQKTERNAEIVRLRHFERLPLKLIADQYDISTARVRAIIKRYGKPKLTDRQLLKLIETHCALNETYTRDKDGNYVDGPLEPIYTWVHAQLSRYKGGCENKHEDWQKAMVEAYEQLKSIGEIR